MILVTFEFDNENVVSGSRFLWKRGYLTTEIFRESLEEGDYKFYMCGSENVQKHVFSQIRELGIMPKNVETEKFGIYMER